MVGGNRMKKRIKRSLGDRIFDIVNTIFMIGMMIIMLYPFWYVAMASFSNSSHLMAHTGILLKPLDFTLDAYRMVAKNPNLISGYLNTILIVGVGTFSSTLVTALGAFVMSRKPFPFKRILMFMMIFTMYFSGGMIPTYILNNNWLHLGNNRLVLILPALVTTYNLIILRTGFEAIPDSLEESAKLDGAKDITILFKIIIPVAMPSIAVIILYYAVGYWNSWFEASIYMTDRSKYPLQVILREILIMNNTAEMGAGEGGNAVAIAESIKYATVMVATVPILCIYPFLQKYFVKGTMIGAVKG